MPTVINTNLASLFAQNNLANAQNNLATSVQRLSSGLRINSAKDDAAGLSISQNMQGQINGVSQSIRNLNDATNLLSVADSSLSTVQDMLLRMKQLTVQGYDGSLSISQKLNIVQELKDLNDEINATAARTNFNGIKLLTSGSALDNVNSDIKNGSALTNKSVALNTSSGLGQFSTLADSAAAGTGGAETTISITLDSALSAKIPGTYTLRQGTGDNQNQLTLSGTFNGQNQTQTVSIANVINNTGISNQRDVVLDFSKFGIKLNLKTTTGANTTETGAQIASAIVARSSSIVVDGQTGAINNIRMSGAAAGTYQLSYSNTGPLASLGLPTNLASGQTSAGTTSAVALKGGSGTGATANITYGADGKITNIDINNAGTGYKSGDILGTDAIAAGVVTAATVVGTDGATPVNESALVTFAALDAGKSITLAGLTYTAGTGGATGAQVANAFSGLTANSTTGAGTVSGSYSGKFAGWSTLASDGTATLRFNSLTANSNVENLQAASYGTATIVSADGKASQVENGKINFVALAAGQKMTIGGLTYTASGANTAAQVATAFANINAGSTSGASAGTGVGKGSYSGSLNNYATTAVNADGSVGYVAVSTPLNAVVAYAGKLEKTSNGGTNAAAAEVTDVTFKDMTAGQTLTLNGLTFTAGSNGASASYVASAFTDTVAAGDSAANQNTVLSLTANAGGTFTAGTATRAFTVAANGTNTVRFTDVTATLTDITDMAAGTLTNASGADSLTTTGTAGPKSIAVSFGDGTTSSDKSVVTFQDISAGQTVSLAGFTFTANASIASPLVADDLAKVFAGIRNGQSLSEINAAAVAAGIGTTKGTFSLTPGATQSQGWNASYSGTGQVTFTSDLTATRVANDPLRNTASVANISITQGVAAAGAADVWKFTAGALSAGQQLTLAGLTFTAGSKGATAAQVANAFNGLTVNTDTPATINTARALSDATGGVFTAGRKQGWDGASAAVGNVVTFTGTAATNMSETPMTLVVNDAPVVNTGFVATKLADGTTSTKSFETNKVTFQDLSAGQTVVINGLTFEAGANGASASYVAKAFQNVSGAQTFSTVNANNGLSRTNGGVFTSGTSVAGMASGLVTSDTDPSVTFTSSAYTNKINLVNTGSGSVSITTIDGAGAVSGPALVSNQGAMPTIVKTEGRLTATSYTINGDLTSGQTLAFDGLTFTAGSSGATKNQQAIAFSNLKIGMTGAEANAQFRSTMMGLDPTLSITDVTNIGVISETVGGTPFAGTLGYESRAYEAPATVGANPVVKFYSATVGAATGAATTGTTATTRAHVAGVTETFTATFPAVLAAGDSMTFMGLTFKAGTATATAAQLATAWNAATAGSDWQTANGLAGGNVSDAIGYFTAGVRTPGFTSTVAGAVVTYTSTTTGADVADPFGINAEKTDVVFGNLGAGQTVTIGDLTFTAGSLGATAAQVKAAFARNSVIGNTISQVNNTYAAGATSNINQPVLNVVSATGIAVGDTVSGTGIDSDTRVVSIAGNAITLNKNLVAAASTIAPDVTTTAATYETSTYTFADITVNQTQTLGGLTFTSGTGNTTAANLALAWSNVRAGMTAADAAAAFTAAGGVAADGTFTSGTFSSTNNAGGRQGAAAVEFTSTLAGNVANLGDTTGTATAVTAVNVAGVNQSAAVTFKALANGDALTFNGLTFTATGALTNAQTALAFANMRAGMTAAQMNTLLTGTGLNGTFTAGQASADWTSAGSVGAAVSFTSTTAGSVSNPGANVAELKSANQGTYTFTLNDVSGGTMSGANGSTAISNWSAAQSTGNLSALTFTSVKADGTNVSDLTVTGPNIAPVVSYLNSADNESLAVQFKSLVNGQSVSFKGLTFQAGIAGASANQVAKAFASLTTGMTAAAANTAAIAAGVASTSGTFTNGVVSAGWSSAATTSDTVTFSGPVAVDKSDLAVSVTGVPTLTTIEGNAGSTESSSVKFASLVAGQSVSLAGLTFTAGTNGISASNLAMAFANLSTNTTLANANLSAVAKGLNALTDGSFTTGVAVTGWNTGNASGSSGDTVLFTSDTPNANVTNLAASLPPVPSVVINQGSIGVRETATTQFQALAAGQMLSLAGLSFTATAAMTASQVAAAFAGLSNGASTGASVALGTYAGQLVGWNTGSVTGSSSDKVVFSSTTNKSDVQNLAVGQAGTAPTIVTTNGGSLSNETSTVTFNSGMSAGDRMTFGGLSFTANRDLTTAEAAAAFKGLAGSATTGAGAGYGRYSGTLTGWGTNNVAGNAVQFSSTALGTNVDALSNSVSQRRALSALSGIVVGGLTADQTDTNQLTMSGNVNGVAVTEVISLKDNAANASQTINFAQFGISFDVQSFQAQSHQDIGAAISSLKLGGGTPGKVIVAQGDNSRLDFQSGADSTSYISVNTANIQTGTTGANAGSVAEMTTLGSSITGSGVGKLGGLGTTDSINTWQAAFQNADAAVTAAVDYISTQRAVYGSQMNRLSYISSNLSAQSTNLQNSRSAIIDTDYAAETAKLTKGQIMQQAATAMLAQANQMPNVILSLLK
jgi:flagellin